MAPAEGLLSAEALDRLGAVARTLLPLGSLAGGAPARTDADALEQLVERLSDTYPFHDPRYAGQMLKPPHRVAWAAYATAMLLNPNNHALDGGPATSALEREAVADIAKMLGHSRHLGHLTASGTIANLEALWVARELHPGAVVLTGDNAHYTHARMCRVLGVEHDTVATDERGRLDPDALAARLERGGAATVVATLGTTQLGALDPLDAVADLCERSGARLHVDAAYGGFFAPVAGERGIAAAPYEAIARADSVVIDPHKHGLQPYGCGCVVFADPSVARLYAHESPYTYFTSPDELHLGEMTLECSRPGAAAAALWATLRALPLTRDGLGAELAASRRAALELAGALAADGRVALVVEPELEIVCVFARRPRASEVSAASEQAFERLAEEEWHVAKLRVDSDWLRRRHPDVEADERELTVLRCCLMKPAHLGVAEELSRAIVDALSE